MIVDEVIGSVGITKIIGTEQLVNKTQSPKQRPRRLNPLAKHNDAIFFGDPDLNPFNGTGVIPRPGLVFPTVATGGQVGSILPPYDATTCGGYQYQESNQDDVSLELRLTSPGDQRLRWVGGLYFADIERDVTVSTGADRGLGLVKAGFVPTSGPNPTDQLYDDTFTSKVYAVFGQLAYDGQWSILW